MLRSLLIGCGVAILLASQAAAQDGQAAIGTDDWDLDRDANTGSMLASASFSTGHTLAVRCQAQNLAVMLLGPLPDPITGTSDVPIAVELEAASLPGRWLAGGIEKLVTNDVPRMTARRLRGGGRVTITRIPDGEVASPYQLDLPSEHRNLDAVLSACGVPLVDARDELWQPGDNMPPLRWARRPEPSNTFPDNALSNGISGSATASCIIQRAGALSDCRVENETPEGAGFGAATVDAATLARLDIEDDSGWVGRLTFVRLHYRAPGRRH